MTNARKLLKTYYFNLKINPPNESGWKSMLPEVEMTAVTSDPEYIKNKDNYLIKGPKLWIYLLIYKHKYLTSKQIFNYYSIDDEALSQNFFNSWITRR